LQFNNFDSFSSEVSLPYVEQGLESSILRIRSWRVYYWAI
jgi:hypothetical protein